MRAVFGAPVGSGGHLGQRSSVTADIQRHNYLMVLNDFEAKHMKSRACGSKSSGLWFVSSQVVKLDSKLNECSWGDKLEFCHRNDHLLCSQSCLI